jgi:polysaccharide export outer membrane protein
MATFAFALLVWNAATAATTKPAAEAAAAGYRLAAGDRIVVTVFDQPELTGEQAVDSTGDISLPLVGSVEVAGLTTHQAQDLVRSRLADGYLVNPSVAVRLGELRPIYVLGSVRKPGVYPFLFGTVVRAAIAEAGGYAGSDPAQRQAIPDALAAETRVRQFVIEQAALLVRQARLHAEIDGADTFILPDLPERPTEAELAQIVAGERDALAERRRIVKEKVELLKAQKPYIQSQIDATNSEMASETKRLELVRAEAARAEALVKQGLGTRTTVIQNQLTEAAQETNLSRLKSETLGLTRELDQIDVRIEDEKLAMQSRAVTELAAIHNRIAELTVLIPAARNERDWKLQQARAIDPDGKYQISITRVRAGKSRVETADSTSLLDPGDLIDVKPAGRHSGWPLY